MGSGGFATDPIAEFGEADAAKVGNGTFAPSTVAAGLFTRYARLLPSKLTAPALVAANHREPALGVALLGAIGPPSPFEIPKGYGVAGGMTFCNWVGLAGSLSKATRRGNRCNAGTGGSTVDPALKGVAGVVTGDA